MADMILNFAVSLFLAMPLILFFLFFLHMAVSVLAALGDFIAVVINLFVKGLNELRIVVLSLHGLKNKFFAGKRTNPIPLMCIRGGDGREEE